MTQPQKTSAPHVLSSWRHGALASPADLCELVLIQLTPDEAPCEMLVSVTTVGRATHCQVICDGRCDLDFAFTPPDGTREQRIAAAIRAALDWRVQGAA